MYKKIPKLYIVWTIDMRETIHTYTLPIGGGPYNINKMSTMWTTS